MRKASFALVVTCVMLCVLSPCGQTDDDVLLIVLQGYKQALSSVQSGKGRAVVNAHLERSDGSQLEAEATYDFAFSGDRFAYRRSDTYLKNDPGDSAEVNPALLIPPGSVVKRDGSFDGEKTRLLWLNDAKGYIGDPTTGSGKVALADYKKVAMWTHDLLKLDKHVRAGVVQPRIAGREVLPDGDECIIVEFSWTDKLPSGGEATQCVWFWVDPQKGFVVPRIRSWSTGGIYKEKTLVGESTTEFRRYGDSLWVPSKTTHDEYRLSKETGEPKRMSREVVTYDAGFQINVPVSDSELGPIRFPSGTKVVDEILKTEYKEP
jgi:hypothetical protein